MNKQLVIIGIIVVIVTVAILKITDPIYFADLGEERRHYFVNMYPLNSPHDFIRLCNSYSGEWVETKDRRGCDFRTPSHLDEFERRIIEISKEDDI